MNLRRPLRLLMTGAAVVLASGAARAEPLQRPVPHAGLIVATKGGEEFHPAAQGWRPAEVRQDLLGGDTLRTNALGNLALLFADQTQVRVGRNSTLVVKQVTSNGPAALELPEGNVWARAARGGSSLTIDTPAAAAAIRGTDWSLTVTGGKTSLVVLEGTVELSNKQGSVTVHEGEAAVATIGSKPTKIVLVRPKDREQMLFYLSLRDAFAWLPATQGDRRADRADRARLVAIPPARRSPEDWLRLAETGLAYDGRAVAAAALARARAGGLSPSQRARADLVEGLIAGSQRRWSEAATLFRRGAPGLDPARRASAVYGAYIADSLANPTRAAKPPAESMAGGVNGVIARAWIAGFVTNVAAALAVVKEGEARYPGNAVLAAAHSRLALLLDTPEDADAAAQRALAIDPGEPMALEADAYVKATARSDLDGALAQLDAAAAIAPGETQIWNAIGLVQSGRDADREAEAAFQRAIAVDPDDPIARANYAIFLLDQSRVDEAKGQIDTTLTLDPSLSFGYSALGRYYLQTGETDKGLENLLAGSVANPSYSQGVLALAIGYYQADDIEPAMQQLDAAARLDPSDPVVPQARAAIALDRFEADVAISSARDALAKIRARGGYYAPLAAAKDAGSYLSDSFRLLELDAWGRYYGDVVFNPFDATGYFDQAINTRVNPLFIPNSVLTPAVGEEGDAFTYSSLLQDLLLDPLAVSGRNRRTDLVRRPFLDSEIGGGLVWRDGHLGWTASAEMQGFSNFPVPTSFFLSVGGLDTSGQRDNDREDGLVGSLLVGSNPTPYDHLVLFGSLTRYDPALPQTNLPALPGVEADIDRTGLIAFGGVGWGHVFGDRNVLTATAIQSYSRDEQFASLTVPNITSLSDRQKQEDNSSFLAVSHLYGIGPMTLRYGVEGSITASKAFDEALGVSTQSDSRLKASRVYADLQTPIGERFQVEAGAYGSFLEGDNGGSGRFDPRIGVAFTPAEGQWLRAAFRRDTDFPVDFTLSPVATLGLLPNLAPLQTGGHVDTSMARWDAEWGKRLFTSIEYQHQELDGVSISIPQTLDSVTLDQARIDRVTANANVWIGNGFGFFATAAWTRGTGQNEALRYDGDIPFLPEHFGRAGLTWVSPEHIKITVAQTYVGERLGMHHYFPSETLDAYTTTDLIMSWEPFERRLAFDASLLNVFDRDFDIAPGTPAPGRTVLGSMKVRF